MASSLLSEERRSWQDPERIFDSVGIPDSGVMVDIGCGPGFFTVPAAARCRGTVIGMDASPHLLSICRSRLDVAGCSNAELVLMDAGNSIPLAGESAELVLIANVLHDMTSPPALLAEVARILKPGGRLVNIDWSRDDSEFGPPQEIRLSADESSSMMLSAGLRIESTLDAGPYHYCQVARK